MDILSVLCIYCFLFLSTVVGVQSVIREEFVDFIEVSDDTSGERLSNELLKLLPEMGLDLNLMRSQCYDGAGNMTGHLKGVGPRIQRIYPKALHFWCTAHQLNRCIVAAANIPCVRNMMGTADKVVQFFNWSPKRQSFLEEQLQHYRNETKRMKLKELCRTRWVERHDVFEIFWDFLPAIIETMEKIKSVDKSPVAISDTQSLENNITSFQFLVSLLVTMRCIGYLKQISTSLQGRAFDVVSALESVNLVKEALQDVRDNMDEFHAKWYSEILKLADELDVTPSKPRTCGRQTKRSNVPCESTEDYYKKTIAIPLLDHMLSEMNSRFGDLQIKASMGLQVIPAMIPQFSTNDFEYFVDDLPSPSTLEQEMHMWKLKWANESDPPSDINTALQNCNSIIFPNVHQILKICGIFPVTSCECERSISRLRLVKTYLRSTMSTSRASSLIMMYAHRNITVNPKEVVMQYARRNPRRIVLPDILAE